MKINKNKKIKLAGLAAFVLGLLYVTTSQTTDLEDTREDVKTAGDGIKTYNSLQFQQSGVSLRQEVINMREKYDKLEKKIDNIKISPPSGRTTIKKNRRELKFFDKKVEMTLGQAFISASGFLYMQNKEDLRKYIYTKGLEKEILVTDVKEENRKKKLKYLPLRDTTFQIFPDKTTLYYLINGDELFITEKIGGKEAYIITKDGRLEKGLEINEDIKNKIEKSIKNRVFNSGDFIIVDKDNLIVENGTFDKYFFQGRQYTTNKQESLEKNKNRFLKKPYVLSNDLYKVEYSLLKNNSKVRLEKGNFYINDTKTLSDIQDLFADKQTNRLILKHEDKLFENDLSPRVTFLLNYTDEFGVFYAKASDSTISKVELNGTTTELGKGNIVLLPNGKITIEITGREVEELTFKEDMKGKTKIYMCKDGKYAVEKSPMLETFSEDNKPLDTYENPKIKIVDKELIINDKPFCSLKNVKIENDENGRTEIHKGDIVRDKDGNRYFEKNGNIYKIDKDGNVEKIGKGKINRDGSISMEDGTSIDSKHDVKKVEMVKDKDGNTYVEKDGNIYKIDKDGNVTKVGKGKINEDGTITMEDGTRLKTTHDTEKIGLVKDKDGNTYMEKDGNIYKIDKDGNVTKVGKGKINEDGTITMEDGSKINTTHENTGILVDKDGNRYIEKDGDIYRIDKDGNRIKVGKGKVNKDGSISMDDGRKIDTQFQKKEKEIVKDGEGNQYFEKDGNIYKIDKDGNITNIGKGKVNKDGSISMDDGRKIDTSFKKTEKNVLKDSDGNQYFEKDGNIYKIDKDGNITNIGKGKVNKDGSISMDDGTIIDTRFDTKQTQNMLRIDKDGNITAILEDIEYQYKDGNLLIDHYILKNEPIIDIKIENAKSFLDFSKKRSIQFEGDRIIQVKDKNWGDFKNFKDTKLVRDSESLSLKKDLKTLYSDTIKSITNMKIKKYLFAKDRSLLVFPRNEMFYENEKGEMTYLEKGLYDVIINKERYIVSIKKKIDLEELTAEQETGENIDIMYDPSTNQLLYIKNGKIINRKDAEDLFNSKVKKYQINMTEPEKMNSKFIVFTENGSELTYHKNGIRYINPNGKILTGEGNLYLTKNKEEVILKQKDRAKSFKIKYINIKNNTLVKTKDSAYIIDKENIIAKHHSRNIYVKLNGFFAISIDKNEDVIIKGPENTLAGKFVEVLDLQNDDYTIVEKIEKGKPPVVKEEKVDYNKILNSQKKYMEKELERIRQELLDNMPKPEPKREAEAINYDLDLIKMKRLFKEPKPNKNGKKNQQPGYMSMGGQLILSRISDKDMEKLLRENNLAETPQEEEYLFLPIGTKFYAKIEEAYEVPVITGANGGTSDINVKFKGIKISRITTPRGEEITFNQDALMLGALKGNRATERIYIYPESVNWYNEEEDKYLKIELSGATKVSSRKDRIEGIPGLFINKKMDNIIMSAGLEMVKGITEAIVASQSPMNSMMNPDMSGLLGPSQTSTTPATGENLGAAALGGASGAFEEIITMMKDDMEGLIPFLVSNEGEDIIITLTKDIRVTERDGGE